MKRGKELTTTRLHYPACITNQEVPINWEALQFKCLQYQTESSKLKTVNNELKAVPPGDFSRGKQAR